ncbi:MAG: SDR family oxidoreductase [Chloroflexi bacterium]|nr:MAG: SDR family oxidoreductase [Chloroflexota bacterium]TMF37305.1 MAG: SDR family oxidoreductase [Chloroflexota bacterium]
MAGANHWHELSFNGRSAVVTGAARGIGRAAAHRLAGLGARTVIWDLDGEVAEQAATELRELLKSQGRPHSVDWAHVDISDADAVEQSMERAVSGDGLDVLVNNAGTTTVHETESMPLELWERTLRINLSGTFYCCRAAIPYLKRRPGAAIVNISSSSALVGGGGGGHYAASKAGIDGLTRHLARELAPDVRVNSIQPRTIETDLFQARYAHAPMEQEKLINQIPLRRLGQPEDIADAIAFLASDWAAYITGQILLIDGGRTYQ